MKLLGMGILCFALLPLSASVLKNGDFFQRNDNNEPTGWQIRYPSADQKQKDAVSAAEGVLTLGGTGVRGELLLIQPNIALKSGVQYRVSFESRGIGGEGNLRVYVQYQKLIDGKGVAVAVNDAWRKTQPEWSKQEFIVDFPENGRSPWFVVNTTGNIPVQVRNLTMVAGGQQEEK